VSAFRIGKPLEDPRLPRGEVLEGRHAPRAHALRRERLKKLGARLRSALPADTKPSAVRTAVHEAIRLAAQTIGPWRSGELIWYDHDVSAAFPLEWPPGGDGRVAYYAGAWAEPREGTTEAHTAARPWARAVVDVTRKKPKPLVEMLASGLIAAGWREWPAVNVTGLSLYAAEEALFDTLRGRAVPPLRRAALQARYVAWADAEYYARDIRPHHPAFFTWLDRPAIDMPTSRSRARKAP